ncbi:MAG TPA: trehalose-phosphatase [Gaiellaceae bacterium]|nr:trehalose-phosphatase [Gaiellaceae bacterium]
MSGDDLLAPLREAPDRSALILDVDGVLAPIVARPELSEVPAATRAELERLAGVYLLVACVSGRSGEDARRLVGVEGVRVVGNHGLELDPRAPELADSLRRFRETVPDIPGAWVEDKGLSFTFHYREAADPEAVEGSLEPVARRAQEAGFEAFRGRKVLEIRPGVRVNKGTAVRVLVRESGARRGLYAGDDTTDLDGFDGLGMAGLEHAVRVAVASEEGPAALRDQADIVVASPAELVSSVLRRL